MITVPHNLLFSAYNTLLIFYSKGQRSMTFNLINSTDEVRVSSQYFTKTNKNKTSILNLKEDVNSVYLKT